MNANRWNMPRAAYKAVLAAAQDNRKHPTSSEAIFWNAVRGNALGLRVRRQQPIGPYIVDFLIARRKLIIEIDGASHTDRDLADREREKNLRSLGYHFFRVTATEVEEQLDEVLERVRAMI